MTHDLATGGETPASLVQELVGPGAVVSNIQYSGSPVAAGTFTGGTGIIGFESGVVLGTGDIAGVVGPSNTTEWTTTQNGTPGDPDLDAIVGETRDASILEFDLECPTGSQISFQYVFTSEEYDQNGADDLFACFLNGQNIALVPGSNSYVGTGRVNCDSSAGSNCDFYTTNSCFSLGSAFPCTHIATEMDGLTVVLSATGTLQPGPNHVKLVIADYYDEIVDTNAFLRSQSFVCSPGAPVFEAPSWCQPVLKGWAGSPFTFEVNAWAANHLPGESVTLEVAGDTIPLANGFFSPPLPTGPAQPVSSQFTWTPTLAQVGSHHLVFTATDQVPKSTVLEVPIQISVPAAPAFGAASPCGQVLSALVGTTFTLGIAASAWTPAECGTSGVPGQAVTLDVTGDAAPLAGGTFAPALPAGPSQPVSTQFHWTPLPADVGVHHLVFTATDQLGRSVSCDVDIDVAFSPPQFQSPIWCGHVMNAYAEQTFRLQVNVAATNGQPGESVVLDVSGDPVPLTGGTFDPPLPAGPDQRVVSYFEWTPTLADIGIYNITYTATDQLLSTTTCDTSIRVWGLPGVDECSPGTGFVIPCPCSNPPASVLRGCDNSIGTGGARLDARGGAVCAQDSLVFTTSGELPTALTILFQGPTLLQAGVAFGQGVRCVGGHLRRLYVKQASGGSITAPVLPEERVWYRSLARGDRILPGSTRYYSAYYRDPTILGGCSPMAGFNATQTLRIDWRGP